MSARMQQSLLLILLNLLCSLPNIVYSFQNIIPGTMPKHNRRHGRQQRPSAARHDPLNRPLTAMRLQPSSNSNNNSNNNNKKNQSSLNPHKKTELAAASAAILSFPETLTKRPKWKKNSKPTTSTSFPFQTTKITTTSSSSSRTTIPQDTTTTAKKQFRVYCDMDGVLVDFDAGVRALSNGVPADDLPKQRMWRLIGRCRYNFYERLQWMPDGRELWEAIKDTQPDILTGVPSNKDACVGKHNWCRRELGVAVNHVDMAERRGRHLCAKGKRTKGLTNVITCWSRNKHFESGEMAVLIDDREDLGIAWKEKGGIFIHHTNTARTLAQLREHGIIPPADKEATDNVARLEHP